MTIGVPPDVDPGGALLLWSALHDLLRPRLARLLSGQPHLAWEVAASETGTTFRVWVPETVPPGLIERAVSSAWPGASTTTEPAGHDEPGEGMVQVASELVLSGPDWFSLNAAMKPDPLPLILGQLAGLRGDQRALVQVLTRPATIREQRRLRTAARRLRAGIAAAAPRAAAGLPHQHPRAEAADARSDDQPRRARRDGQEHTAALSLPSPSRRHRAARRARRAGAYTASSAASPRMRAGSGCAAVACAARASSCASVGLGAARFLRALASWRRSRTFPAWRRSPAW